MKNEYATITSFRKVEISLTSPTLKGAFSTVCVIFGFCL